MVSAWASENHLVLGQLKVNEKSNEITAIPLLLNLLDVEGSIVTIDAIGTQTNIAQKNYKEQSGLHPLGQRQSKRTFLSW